MRVSSGTRRQASSAKSLFELAHGKHPEEGLGGQNKQPGPPGSALLGEGKSEHQQGADPPARAVEPAYAERHDQPDEELQERPVSHPGPRRVVDP